MSTTRLPELPELPEPPEHDEVITNNYGSGHTDEQLQQYARAYGLAVWKAAMQYAAEEADKALTNGRSPLGRLVAQGILALPLPEQGGPQ